MAVLNPATMKSVQEMYVEHKGWLSMFIQRRMGCPEAAADLVQDTYMRLLVKGSLPSTKDSRRYLTHIAKGLVIDNYRRKRVESAYLEYIAQQPEPVAVSPEEKTQMIESLIEIDTLLNRLPSKAREAFLLRQMEGLSYKEIAAQMGVSVSSVEKYVAKALQACMMSMMNTWS